MGTLAEDVRAGLTAPEKHISSLHFYDAAGSALFEEITRTPEYYLTETERGILLAHADAIVDAADAGPCLAELGAGSAYKTRILIEAVLRRHARVTYAPIDVSEAALAEAQSRVDAAFGDRVHVRPLLAHNRDGLRTLAYNGDAPHLVLFLGSSIGNMDTEAAVRFLSDVRDALRPQDAFLLGTDMVKDPEILVPAYKDAAGVTTRFNLNLLARVNRELDADFDLTAWEHVAKWNADKSRMESHLLSAREQTVHVRALDLTVHFAKGEGIHTECSYKYTKGMVADMVERAGFTTAASWYDAKAWFGLHLLKPRDDAG